MAGTIWKIRFVVVLLKTTLSHFRSNIVLEHILLQELSRYELIR